MKTEFATPRGSAGGKGASVPHTLTGRFGGLCPACREYLGAVPPVDPETGRFTRRPSLRLEVCAQVAGQSPWRLSIIGRPKERLGTRTFVESEIEYTYLICGNGHLFVGSAAWGGQVSEYSVDEWNTVATVGCVASGKSYLLTRVLQQSLRNIRTMGDGRRSRMTVEYYAGAPVEIVPLELRKRRYRETLVAGAEIPATADETLMPRQVLISEVSEDLVDAISDLFEDNVDPNALDLDRWGMQSPQPIVVRSKSGIGRQTKNGWTCVADLYGEFFHDQGQPGAAGMREKSNLRGYRALVWVIDPIVEAETFDVFAEPVRQKRGDEAFDRLVRGSLRPLSIQADGVERMRLLRRDTQRAIARRIGLLDSELLAPVGGQATLLAAVSKVDAFWTALKEGARLDQLGEKGLVRLGIARYLYHVAEGAGTRIFPDQSCGEILRHVDPRVVADERVRTRNLQGLARDLVRFYSNPQNFWALAHEGSAARIQFGSLRSGVGAGAAGLDGGRLDGPSVPVPSIDQHVDAALQARQGPRGEAVLDDLLGMRDLVMSALGCGLMFGLGYGEDVVGLLEREWVDLRFFLCSPLAAAPGTLDGGQTGLKPLEQEARFALSDARSAALTQLLLRILRGVL